MIKDALYGIDVAVFGTAALVIFVSVFVGSAAWILLKPRKQIDRWACLALDEKADRTEAN
ncbi:MAG: hypothetical protein AAGD32_04840 [Planctomycetota bacterium]